MEGHAIWGLVFSDEEVWSWDDRAEQPAVRGALEGVHRAGKKLLAGGAAEVPLEVLLDGRDHERLSALASGETLEPHALYAVAATLAPADAHLAAHMCVAVSRWYAEALLEGRDDKDLSALSRALARFCESHGVSPVEALSCYGRDPRAPAVVLLSR